MVEDRIGGWPEDEVGDVADDVIYVDDPDEDAEDEESVWASIVTGAHHAFRWSRGKRGGADGTGAG